MSPRARRVALVQSAYFLATGLAPFASRRAFEAVTGAGAAAGLGVVDVVHHRRGRLRWTYLIDAAAEAAIVAAWADALIRRR